ncbi:hypothetical protein [Bacteroides salyersiae]|uniref:hypothetical protein n=1 Tax=Bacteroides salyersiae TaxID=291644 RepID=UPI000326E6BE|nr:hypothetical protein [Bacteroides salyersiae]EOA48957.1 hypothetical protein HMPREF1532_02591 [Bacteroides salyersiae WAL 10018 = DSM 18765 = JCM 12988]
MNIHFEYKNTPISIPITEQQLKADKAGTNDFWGEFEYDREQYQIQIYQSTYEVAIFKKEGNEPISYSKFDLINVKLNRKE